MDKISIIIPTYNRSNYVVQSIESALTQDYSNIEVILSDDASNDNTSEVIKKYLCDKRFKYFRNSSNLGMAPNWRKALFEYATGDWALILGDDDFFINNSYLTNAMKLTMLNKDIVMVHANCQILFEKEGYSKYTDKKLPDIVSGKWMFLNYKYAVRGNINYDLLTVIFNRKIAININFFHDNILTIDRESFLKMSLHGDIGFIKDIVAVYRLHGSNLIRSLDTVNFFDNLMSIVRPYDYAKELNCFKLNDLEKWKKRMIREYTEDFLIGKLTTLRRFGDKLSLLNVFVKKLYMKYPFTLTILIKLLKPKVFAKVLGVHRIINKG